MAYYSRAVLNFTPCVAPQERHELLFHRKRRVRKRALVRLCRRFQNWCRRMRDGGIRVSAKERQYYAVFANTPLRAQVAEERALRVELGERL